MTTPYWSDFVPNSTFYRILSGFHRTFATGVACRQGTLTPPDTWSRPFTTCICSTCWDNPFPNLSLFYRTTVFEYPSVLSRFSLGTFGTSLSNFWNYIVCLRITDEGSIPEMRIWSILLIESNLKWCIHLSRSLFLYIISILLLVTLRRALINTVIPCVDFALLRTPFRRTQFKSKLRELTWQNIVAVS